MTPGQKAIQLEGRIKLVFFLGALVFLLLAVTQINNLLISLLLAFVAYYSMAPAVDFLERRGFSRQIATTLPFAVVTIGMIASLQIFLPMLMDQAESLRGSFPKYLASATELLQRLEIQATEALAKVYPSDFKLNLEPKVMEYAQGLFQNVPSILSHSLTIFFLSPFLTYFMLLDGRAFTRQILALVPNSHFELALNLNNQISQQIGGFIRARFMESLIVGAVIWLGLMILGFPYALVLAVFAGIMNVIPYVGPFIGAVPAFVINFSNGDSHSALLWLSVIYATAQVLDIVLIVPFVVAKIVDLHPVTVVLVVIAGSQLMGILGMIISIPVFSALKVSASAIYRHMTDFRV